MYNRNAVTLENCKVMYSKTSPNFSGRAHEYNNEGNRNFCMFIEDDDQALAMKNAGWDIRVLAPRDDHPEDEPKCFIPVSIKYRDMYGSPVKYPPRVYVVNSSGKAVEIGEKALNTLDNKQIKYVDVILNPRVKDDGTFKAYVSELYVVAEENRLSEKYALDEAPEDDLSPGDDPFGV